MHILQSKTLKQVIHNYVDKGQGNTSFRSMAPKIKIEMSLLWRSLNIHDCMCDTDAMLRDRDGLDDRFGVVCLLGKWSGWKTFGLSLARSHHVRTDCEWVLKVLRPGLRTRFLRPTPSGLCSGPCACLDRVLAWTVCLLGLCALPERSDRIVLTMKVRDRA